MSNASRDAYRHNQEVIYVRPYKIGLAPTLSVPPTLEEIEAFTLYLRNVFAAVDQAEVVRARQVAKAESAYQAKIKDILPAGLNGQDLLLQLVDENWENIPTPTPKTLQVSGGSFKIIESTEGALAIDKKREAEAIAFIRTLPEADAILKTTTTIQAKPLKDWLKKHPGQTVPGHRMEFTRTAYSIISRSPSAERAGFEPRERKRVTLIPDPSS